MSATAVHDVVRLPPLHSLKHTKERGSRLIGKHVFPQLYSQKPPTFGLGYGNHSFITCYHDHSAGSGGCMLGASEIKEKCSKWQWTGQYSINDFVSSSSNAESNPSSASCSRVWCLHSSLAQEYWRIGPGLHCLSY
ncbi:hypothetical protein REPUB_Repub01dG0153400 [Reevesia pubescens]